MRLVCLFLAAAVLHGATLLQKNIDSFEYVWTTIRDKHWDKSLDGPEWKKVHDELLPRIRTAETLRAGRSVIGEMIARLHLTHYGILPSDTYSQLENAPSSHLDIRVIDGSALIVSGKNAGCQLLNVNDTIERVARLYQNSTLREMMLARAAGKALKDPVRCIDGQGHTRTIQLDEDEETGEPTSFGFLPTQYVSFESKQLNGAVGYVKFNLFLDPARLLSKFGDAVAGCRECKGFVVDLRGNPGGIGGMAMGMAGFFVTKPGQQLGTMYTRSGPLKFFINPRQPSFEGPLAILVDGLSASTAEIFAGGLKDLGRARIFGSRTAGAALPSLIERLPNGDGFQYAIANYISAGGKELEGHGVTPDVEVSLDRAALLSSRDPVLDAALKWIHP